jgi:hypothetical protein
MCFHQDVYYQPPGTVSKCMLRLPDMRIEMQFQASIQEKVQQHKEAVEDSARLRLELQRFSDDRDQLANQVHHTIPAFEIRVPSNSAVVFCCTTKVAVLNVFKQFPADISSRGRKRNV